MTTLNNKHPRNIVLDAMLDAGVPLKAREIAARSGKTMQATHFLLVQMRADGYVERALRLHGEGCGGGRYYQWFLTGKPIPTFTNVELPPIDDKAHVALASALGMPLAAPRLPRPTRVHLMDATR